MKLLFSTIILFFYLNAVGQKGGTFQKGGTYRIIGTADTLNGIAILNDYENPDTVKIINGKFEFRGELGKPNMIAIQVPPDYSSRIILEPGTIYVNHSDGEYTFGGAPLNERFQHIEDELKPLNKKIRKYWSAYNKAEGDERIKIWRKYDQAKKEKFELAKQLITNDGTFAGFVESLTVASYEDAKTLKHYLDIFDFLSDDSRYQRLHDYYEGVARTAEGVIPPQWTLPDENGNKVSLSDFKGKYVLIDFWYSGCHWCRKMTPGLKDIYQDIKGKGFEIVSISVDPEEDEAKWRKAMEEDGAPWVQVWDKEKTLPPQYSIRGYPTMYLLGPDGKVLEKIRGYHDEPILREIFKRHMSKGASNVSLISSLDDLPADTVFNNKVNELIRNRDVEEKEELYVALLKDFPENSDFRKKRYLNARTTLALFWSSKGNAEKVLKYYSLIKGKVSNGFFVAIGSNLVKHQKYKEAIQILEDAKVEITASFATGEGSLYNYLKTYDAYAQSLFHLGKKNDALLCIETAYKRSDKENSNINSTYAIILNGLNKHTEALPVMEKLVRNGMASEKIKKIFQESYMEVKNNQSQFVKLMASLQNELKTKMEKEAEQKMVKKPAFTFSLMDMSGKEVSLSDMKGKVVILDFWATWCGPCIKSLPAMQMAVNHYKDDPNVKFLFINTGERIPNFKDVVEEFINKNNYELHVLYDVRNPKTSKYPVASGFDIKGIPTKLIIDGKGQIRYKLVGFNGGNDATVAELIAMIDNIKIQ